MLDYLMKIVWIAKVCKWLRDRCPVSPRKYAALQADTLNGHEIPGPLTFARRPKPVSTTTPESREEIPGESEADLPDSLGWAR